MGYHGGSLVSLVSAATVAAPTDRLLRNVANAGGAQLTRRARELTPRRTGKTAASWQHVQAVKIGGGYVSSATNSWYLARFLEDGTKGHDVHPNARRGKRAVSTPEGARAGAHIPPMVGRHMLGRAAAELEATLPVIAQPHLDAWASEIERIAKTQPGVS